MRHTAAHTKHEQEKYLRRLRAASLIGAFLSFFAGACVIPFLWATLLWVLRWTGWALFGGSPPGVFHGLLDYVAAPSLSVGLFWLLYYAVGYLAAKWFFSSSEPTSLQTLSPGDGIDPLGLAPVPPSRKQQPVLSRACPGELKHELVERCYQEYRKALLRYDPPPVNLKTPPTFYYAPGVQLGWNKKDLLPILPEEVLTPESIHLLLAPLAQHLAWYNSDEPNRLRLHDYPDCVPLPWLLIPTGNFLWVPVMLKHMLEVPTDLPLPEEQREQAHEASQFACYLGQGSALEHLLRRLQAELKKRGMEDTNFPTLSERTGHLEVMNKREREQMRQLGLTPEEPPLMKGKLPPRLSPGKTQHPW
jgi:hypothetical protein